jgi:hypothetical protein
MFESLNNRVWSTWTSLFFLIPGYLAFMQEKSSIAVLLCAQTVFSIFYHLEKPKGPDWWWRKKKIIQHLLQITDTLLAIIISVHIVVSIFNIGLSISAGYIFFSGVVSLYIFFACRNTYEAYHGLWHLTASLTILLWLMLV